MEYKKWRLMALIFCVLLILIPFVIFVKNKKNLDPIPVGILFSSSGSLALTEKDLINVTLMAIDEINKTGGVLGRPIHPVVIDGKSDEEAFKKGAQDLIEHHKVAAIFGAWHSSMRKKVKEVVEQHKNLLLYPAFYEGLEESTDIAYMGAVPNQVLFPALWWFYTNIGKDFFLIGSDSIFSKAIHEIMALRLADLGGRIVGQELIINESDIDAIVSKIVQSKPKVIINTIDPQLLVPFFKKLRQAGVSSEKVPSLTLNINEVQMKYLDHSLMVGDYAALSYAQSIYRDENIRFLKNYQQQYGVSSVVDAVMESAYANVYMWKQAVHDAGSSLALIVIPHLKRQVFNAPGGVVYFDNHQLQAWRAGYLGKIQSNGQFFIIWSLKKPIKPLIYPPYKNQQYWDQFVKQLEEKGSHDKN